jgi:hypothetical protein
MSILVLTSDTLIGTPATGNLEYNGQFYGTDSNASRAQMQRITQGTVVASTSGTSIDFTGLPAWVKRITVLFQGTSTSGTSSILVQIGSGSVQTTGYISTSILANNSNTTTGVSSVAGMAMFTNNAADIKSGSMVLHLISGNIWVSNHTAKAITTASIFGGGDVTLGGTLDRLRITTVNGTDTFDAGSINILYEG